MLAPLGAEVSGQAGSVLLDFGYVINIFLKGEEWKLSKMKQIFIRWKDKTKKKEGFRRAIQNKASLRADDEAARATTSAAAQSRLRSIVAEVRLEDGLGKSNKREVERL